MIIIPLGNQKCFITLFKFLVFNLFISKRLHHTDTVQSILQAGVYISDLSSVFHKSFLHSCVLLKRKYKHDNDQNDQWKCQLLIDKKQKNKSPDDLDQRDKEVLRTVVCKF